MSQLDLVRVSEHMKGLGLGALAHANWHANYFSIDNSYWSELSVLQAAHAAEILIKARIAQEHPLLIFEQLPKPDASDGLAFERLLEGGRTYQFFELPDRLWAATGMRLANAVRYKEFGRLRNAIQHFAPPARDVADDAIRFIFEVVDPFIHECWGLYAIDFNEDHEPYTYFVAGLISRGVRFLVSPDLIGHGDDIEFDWPKDDPNYRADMETRFAAARAALAS